MTNHSDTSESDLPIEQQGLPTSPIDDDEPGRSFSGDKPDAGADGSTGTKSDDLDADDADAAREADDERQSAARADVTQAGGQRPYAENPASPDAPLVDVEPNQNANAPLGRQL